MNRIFFYCFTWLKTLLNKWTQWCKYSSYGISWNCRCLKMIMLLQKEFHSDYEEVGCSLSICIVLIGLLYEIDELFLCNNWRKLSANDQDLDTDRSVHIMGSKSLSSWFWISKVWFAVQFAMRGKSVICSKCYLGYGSTGCWVFKRGVQN